MPGVIQKEAFSYRSKEFTSVVMIENISLLTVKGSESIPGTRFAIGYVKHSTASFKDVKWLDEEQPTE